MTDEKTCYKCDSAMERERRDVLARYLGMTRQVTIEGWYCQTPGCDGSLLVGRDMRPIEAAVREMMCEARLDAELCRAAGGAP
jgi:hypothetical protein